MVGRHWSGLALAGLGLVVAACGSSDEDPLFGGNTGGTAPEGGSGGASGGAGGTSAGGTSGSGGSGATSTGGAAGSAGSGATGGGPGNELRFVAMGDCGKGNNGQKQVGVTVAAKCAASGCDFVQLLGDNIYDSGVGSLDDPAWQEKFEGPYAAIDKPFWVVLGNHDYGGNGAGFEVWRAELQVQYTQKSKKWRLPGKHYKHPEPGVDFIALDTNEAMFGNHDQQKVNAAKWISESTTKWKIALGHHPYLSNGPHGNAGTYEGVPFVPVVSGQGVKELMDSTICGKVDVYISGHDHSLQWLQETCQGTELLVSGGGASFTDLPGKNPVHWASAQLGFLYVIVTDTTFTGEFYDEFGNLEYTRTLTKP